MATPLFVPDEDTLKRKLRLSALVAGTDAVSIFDEAVLRARVRLFKALGASRVSMILSTPFTELPSTDEEILRALAAIVEVKIVNCILLRTLPNAFMDASGEVNKSWNEEAPIRERTPEELDAAIERCENEIVADLQTLCDLDLDDCPIQVFDGSPDCPAPRVGLSLKWPSGTRFTSNDPS